jgi:hypothetical protein
MRELEQMLAQLFMGGRPKRQAPVRTVTWIAIMEDGVDSIYLANIKEARAIAANGWKYEGDDVALIQRNIYANENIVRDEEYWPGDPIIVQR